jgi:hypothetical protein
MPQGNGLQEVEVETEEPADRAADLGNLHGVYRPVRYMLIELGSEIDHLGFADISAEPAAVKYPVAVAGEFAAEVNISDRTVSARLRVPGGKWRKVLILLGQDRHA